MYYYYIANKMINIGYVVYKIFQQFVFFWDKSLIFYELYFFRRKHRNQNLVSVCETDAMKYSTYN